MITTSSVFDRAPESYVSVMLNPNESGNVLSSVRGRGAFFVRTASRASPSRSYVVVAVCVLGSGEEKRSKCLFAAGWAIYIYRSKPEPKPASHKQPTPTSGPL